MSNSFLDCCDCGIPFHPDFMGFECKKCDSHFGECCVDDPDDFKCPVCNLKVISEGSLLSFALSKLKKTREELEKDCRKERARRAVKRPRKK